MNKINYILYGKKGFELTWNDISTSFKIDFILSFFEMHFKENIDKIL